MYTLKRNKVHFKLKLEEAPAPKCPAIPCHSILFKHV